MTPDPSKLGDQRLKLIHVTAVRALPAGIRKQIVAEANAAERLNEARWDTLALHGGPAVERFERQIPLLMRPMFLRNLYTWIALLGISKRYDFVLCRHTTFDPFAMIFAPFVRNRVSVHHSKEVEELPLIRPGLAGRLASWVERLTGRSAVRGAVAVLGVTPEIARYQVDTRSPGKPHSVYANGIDLQSTQLADDLRSPDGVNAVFLSNTFSAWHGLDRLVDAVRNAPTVPEDLTIHVIGALSERQRDDIAALGDRSARFRVYGFLESSEYNRILASADAGIGSLAMDRQNLTEGSTLKVREMLAMGLPVYSGHADPSFPAQFPFYACKNAVNISDFYDFALSMKQRSRDEVRSAAAIHIEKLSAMRNVVGWLSSLDGQSRSAGRLSGQHTTEG